MLSTGIITFGDESKLRRVIMNIVNNATEALTDHKIPNPAIDITVQKNETETAV